jgi:hypothetical protein
LHPVFIQSSFVRCLGEQRRLPESLSRKQKFSPRFALPPYPKFIVVSFVSFRSISCDSPQQQRRLKVTERNASNTSYCGFSKEVHDLAQGYLNYEVLKCDSLLVDTLMKTSNETVSFIATEFHAEKIENYFDISMETVEEFLTYNCERDDWQELAFDEKEQLAYSLGFQPQPHEIFEWWAVTGWLAEQLQQIGQPVLDNDFGHWWGRTCTGQAIILDGVMQKIAEIHSS